LNESQHKGVFKVKKIFVIEDEQDISNLYKMLFEREGIEVAWIAEDGKTAIEKIDEIKEKLHDVVFLIDHRIPEKAGLEIAKRILELAPTIKEQIIIASADDTIPKEELEKLGIKYFLQKPFSLEKLLEIVEAINK